MPKLKVDPSKKREAVLDVIAGKKSLRKAAKDLGISAPTLHEAVKAARENTEAAAAVPRPVAGQPEQAQVQTSALDKALEAAGEKPVDPKAAVQPGEIIGRIDNSRTMKEEYCVRQIAQNKKLACFLLVNGYFKIKGEEAKVSKIAALGPDLEAAIKSKAEELYDIMEPLFGRGWFALIVAGAVEGWTTLAGLQEIARAQGWKEPTFTKKEAPRPAAAPQYTYAAPTPPPPPRDGVQSENRANGPMGVVSDAPAAPFPIEIEAA